MNTNNSTKQQATQQQQQKVVKKKLGKFIKRTFAKPKPGPLHVQTTAGEQDALLLPGGVINCHANALESPSACDSQSAFSNATPSSTFMSTTSSKRAFRPHLLPHHNLATNDIHIRSHPSSGAISDASSLDPNMDETEEERALRIARAQEEIRAQMTFSVWHCLAAILVYVGFSIVCFSFVLEQKWTFLTSSYFAGIYS